MKKAVFRGKQETLAEYYVRAHGHLLEDVSVIEIPDDGTIKIVRDGSSIPAEAYYGYDGEIPCTCGAVKG